MRIHRKIMEKAGGPEERALSKDPLFFASSFLKGLSLSAPFAELGRWGAEYRVPTRDLTIWPGIVVGIASTIL